MGAQWKAKPKADAAAAKGKLFTKLAKEIMVAARGGADPDMNARLRKAIDQAKRASMPKDTLERAIKKGAGLLDGEVHYEHVTYEGFAPHRVPVIVECLTDNRNRTAPDMRSLFREGQFGAKVMFLFDHVGTIEATHANGSTDREGAAIEAGAQDVEPLEETPEGQCGARFFTEPADLDAVLRALKAAGWSVTTSEMGYRPKDKLSLSPEQRGEVEEFLEAIDDHDDCHRIYTTLA